MEVRGKNAIVIGLGRSGVAAATLLAARGANVTANDSAPLEKWSEQARALADIGVTLAPGGHHHADFANADFVVISPGVPSFAALDAFEAIGREVIGEMELGSRFNNAPIVLIGGTNGKSTTTALTAKMFEEAGKKTFLGGNFGTPLCEVVSDQWDVLVLEISSFQAERVPTMHARAHALLNITDDHLDRYTNFNAYAHAKGNPFVRMNEHDFAVIPKSDSIVLKQAQRGNARVITFSATDPSADVAFDGVHLVDHISGANYPVSTLRIAGRHNLENACAAIGLASSLGVSSEAIARALAAFEGLGHRTVRVASINGVTYYDDSKGTNVGASVAALRGLLEPKAVLIAGGRDKLGDYAPLVDALREKGRALVLIGEAADRIAEAAAGVLTIERAGTMAEAVEKSSNLAQQGDAVLLSPACSSFDMFRDYKERGDIFVQAVQELARRAPPCS
ncbi:MAG: UDP-N-acetylmuramoyl-L-alanine--D-glutamate ligase [Polyangiaceae bacterium]|nr:UDP-N-acetylmuramoyl-L-alanine--D-glutamate ligase [Polyangiaceae bacterium]